MGFGGSDGATREEMDTPDKLSLEKLQELGPKRVVKRMEHFGQALEYQKRTLNPSSRIMEELEKEIKLHQFVITRAERNR